MQQMQTSRYRFKGPTGGAAWCDVTVYRGADESVVVVCAECPDNPGVSITNYAEELAMQLWQRLHRPAIFSWIEHYPAAARPTRGESWDLVSFRLQEGCFVEVQWGPIQWAALTVLLAGPGIAGQLDWHSIRLPALVLDCRQCSRPLGAGEVLAGAGLCAMCADGPFVTLSTSDTERRRALTAWQVRITAHEARLGLDRAQRIELLRVLIGARSLWSLSPDELYAYIDQVEAFRSAGDVDVFLAEHRPRAEGL